MLRDEVGGAAVNLTAGPVKQDIYGIVAKATLARMAAEPGEYSARWLEHGISRAVVKRSVMTTPYGVTKQSATKYVQSDYLMTVPNPFTRNEYRAASTELMKHAWPAIGDVLVKGTQAMRWLKSAGRQLAKTFDADKEPVLTWSTPSGFPAGQAYFDYASFRVITRLAGTEVIKMVQETDDPDLNKHSAGLAPNFVHSLDAAHLHMTAASFADASIDAGLAMVHDDYGTTAADSELLATLIRQKFVELYENNDPLADLRQRYPELPPVPAPGNLDIREVLRSEFFFS
jgi:DNA-directed RNA polymerase